MDDLLAPTFLAIIAIRGNTSFVEGSIRSVRSDNTISSILYGNVGGLPFGLPVGLYGIAPLLQRPVFHVFTVANIDAPKKSALRRCFFALSAINEPIHRGNHVLLAFDVEEFV